jgi:prolipoprotein diacylglyceryltransferase
VAYGGFIGGLLGSASTCYRNGFSLWKWADAAVPALGTGS